MLHLFRNNTPYTVILLAIFTLLIKLPALVHPLMPVAPPDEIFYSWVLHIMQSVLGTSAFGFTFIAVVMLLGQAIYLTAIASKYRLFAQPSYLPAFAYLVFTTMETDYSYLSAALLANWCLLGAIDMMMRLPQLQPRKQLFNMGFLIALATLLQFSYIVLIVWFAVAMLILRPVNLSEWMVGLLGCFTPLYFFCGILFLLDKLPLFYLWVHVGISLPRQLIHPVHIIGIVAGILLLVSLGVYALQGQMSKTAVSARRAWTSIGVCTLVTIIAAVLSPAKAPASWMITMPPLSLLAVPPLYNSGKSRRFSIFIFWFFIALLLFSIFFTNK